jgi:hypothetical protein
MSMFPRPTRINGLHAATGERTRWGSLISVRVESAWLEIGAERNADVAIVEKWRDAALADGWIMSSTYAHEDVNRACTLIRHIKPEPGIFKVHLITRPSVLTGDIATWSLGEGSVHAWGPDDMSIRVPLEYPGTQYFADALTTCPHCHKGPNRLFFTNVVGQGKLFAPVATTRYSFAGRCCQECAPALREKHERPGWCD